MPRGLLVGEKHLALRLHDALPTTGIEVSQLHAEELAGCISQLADDRTLAEPCVSEPAGPWRIRRFQPAATQIHLRRSTKRIDSFLEYTASPRSPTLGGLFRSIFSSPACSEVAVAQVLYEPATRP